MLNALRKLFTREPTSPRRDLDPQVAVAALLVEVALVDGVYANLESDQIAEIGETALGTRQFQLVGVADFLTAEGLLRSGDRALFTTPDQVNATGELRDGRTVLVKGLLIETDGDPRINLVAVVGLEDKCR